MFSPDRPVSYRDIAARVGVSVAAVSLAMRDSPKISLAVRERVKKAAEEMNYRPNPLLSVYQASVRNRKPVSFQAVIGWINDWPDENEWELPYMKPMLDGARERAEALGYQVDTIWVPDLVIGDPEGSYARWKRILNARGIQGVILPGMTRIEHTLLEWQDFSVVCIGKYHSVNERKRRPLQEHHPHHRVCSDSFFNMRLAIQSLRRMGCRRIGLAVSHWVDDDTDQGYSAIYARCALDWPANERVPIHFDTEIPGMRAWVAKHRPDAVICTHQEARETIESADFRVPEEVRLVHLNLAGDVANWSGIDRRLKYLGYGAVDSLSAHLIRNERGVPLFAKEVNIEGVWVDGET